MRMYELCGMIVRHAQRAAGSSTIYASDAVDIVVSISISSSKTYPDHNRLTSQLSHTTRRKLIRNISCVISGYWSGVPPPWLS